MDQNRLSFIAHRTHRFASPVSVEMLDRVLATADPAPGALAFDLGCGPGNMAIHLAERCGVRVKAVDRSPLMIEEARSRVAASPAADRIELHTGSSIDFLAREGEADLLVAIGAIVLTDGAQDAQSVMTALARHVRTGGCLLWGESHWRKPPSEMLTLLLGQTAAVYGSHTDYVRAGEAAGLLPLYAVASSDQELDEYNWRYMTALENYLRDHPDDPDAAVVRNRTQGWRALHLAEARDTLGFGLYLFRKV